MNKSKAAILLEDIQLLIAAHERLIEAKKRIRSLAPVQLQAERIDISPKFAAWLYYKGLKTEDQVFEFCKKAWDDSEIAKRQFFSWHGPDDDESIPEVDRLLDRIDMAMGLIAKQTQTTVPVKTVRNYGWHPEQVLRRILAFAEAASDLE